MAILLLEFLFLFTALDICEHEVDSVYYDARVNSRPTRAVVMIRYFVNCMFVFRNILESMEMKITAKHD